MAKNIVQKEYITMKISDLVPYERNNKKHASNVDEIVKSIKANTFLSPIIVDENNIIICGHGRKLALEKMGIVSEQILKVTGLTEIQKRDYRLRDNKLSELSEWDYENIRYEVDDLDIDDLTALFPPEEEKEFENKEIEMDDLGGFDCKCPKCGFEFNKE